jgi:hypothetical protein
MTAPILSAPYAPPASVIQVIKRYRDRGLPDPVTNSSLVTVGVSEGTVSRVTVALKFLGLIDEEGHRTEDFEQLKRANSGEYQGVLAEILRKTYRPIFELVDPAEDDIDAITDVFRRYEPSAQRTRMVTLFLGLCVEAGLAPNDKRPAVRPAAVSKPRYPKPQVDRKPDEVKKNVDETPRREEPVHSDYKLLHQLLQQLPKDGKWTQKQRDRWMQAMTANTDLLIEVIDEPSPDTHKLITPDS